MFLSSLRSHDENHRGDRARLIPHLFSKTPVTREHLLYDWRNGEFSDNRAIWWINQILALNGGWIFYIILTVAIGLQQFERTEPATGGVFWISILGLILGSSCTYRRDSNGWRLVANLAINLIALAVQILLIIFYWETLQKIDDVLRHIRVMAVSPIPGASHLLPGWIIWGIVSLFFWGGRIARGYFIKLPAGRRPWW